MREIYFRSFKLPSRGHYFWHLLKETKEGDLYYLHTSGLIAVRQANGAEKILKADIINGDKCVHILGQTYKLKNLVAEELYAGFNPEIHKIKFKDKNPLNCDCYNLQIEGYKPKRQRRTRTQSKINADIIKVNDTEYEGYAEAAKILNCHSRTLFRYIKGETKNSCLSEHKIELVKKEKK